MPKSYLPRLTCPIASEVVVASSRIKKNLGRGAKCRVASIMDVARTGRIRAVKPDPIVLTMSAKGAVRSPIYLRPLPIRVSSVVEVESFVATIPAAPPEGKLYRASIRGLMQTSNQPTLNGSRLVKGDLIPLCFKVEGQRMTGLTAQLTAKQKLNPTAAPILKSGSAIHQTSPVLDPQTETEMMMGQLAIEPSDTTGLPELEVEFHYQLKLTDGNGRVYTVETGFFTVYPAI